MLWKKSKGKWFKIFDSEAEALDSIPLGTMAKVLADNREICLIRTKNGFHAVDNVCPHMGAPLSNGKCIDEQWIECPFHRYKFSITDGTVDRTGAEALEVFELKVGPSGMLIKV